ncbi:MAG: cysteine--tRNA ligase [Candidatus Hermodarchaeota archaeon]
MIRLYNTLSRQKEDFNPLKLNEVRMYVCGPTVYDVCHLGHARSFIAFDVIRRWFIYKGYKVTYVQNITDIDDKMINRAQELNMAVKELAEEQIQGFFRDLDALNIMRADVHPKATDHIKEMIELIQILEKKGLAYNVEGDVYFDVLKYAALNPKNYGQLSNLNLEQAIEEAKEKDHDPKKINPIDFALWKAQKPGEPAWETPWGKGRPGWHIECSAMSLRYLGNLEFDKIVSKAQEGKLDVKEGSFDIHGGGRDLTFPHHENEIAQSDGALDKQVVKYWMHNGFLTLNKEKMSKSLGNFFTIQDILKHYPAKVVRYFLATTHYRSTIDFSDEQLESARKSLARLEDTLELVNNAVKGVIRSDKSLEDSEELLKELVSSKEEEKLLEMFSKAHISFGNAMDDDFNAPQAIAALFELSKELNPLLRSEEKIRPQFLEHALLIFLKLGWVLGLFEDFGRSEDEDSLVVNSLMDLILEIRQNARSKKDWTTADKIRDRLKELGFVIEDISKEKSVWKRA